MTQQEMLEVLGKNIKHLGLDEREQHIIKHIVMREDVEVLYTLLTILKKAERYGYNRAAGTAQEIMADLNDIFDKVMSL